MPTYTIVDKDKDPLDPGEINAGTSIAVSDGDIFIIDPTANSNVIFTAASGSPAFDMQINASNANNFNLTVGSNLTPSVSVADNVDASSIGLDVKNADASNFTAGNTVSFGKFEGSITGADTILIGDGFTTNQSWTTDAGNDSITYGNNATINSLDTGTGDDTVIFGDGADVENIETKDGNDSVRFGDDAIVNDIKGGANDDTFYLGDNATVNNVDGGDNTDALFTQTTGLSTTSVESTTVVCFAKGTHIETPDGARMIQDLRIGDLVNTKDRGARPIRWIHSSNHALGARSDPARPILISAEALGPTRPSRDLVVSPQHRILIGGHQQLHDLSTAEVFAHAKSLTTLPGIRYMHGKRNIQWFHFAFDHHDVVVANGCLAESLLLSPMVLAGQPRTARHMLFNLFPKCQPEEALNGPPARPCLSVGAVARLISVRQRQKAANLQTA